VEEKEIAPAGMHGRISLGELTDLVRLASEDADPAVPATRLTGQRARGEQVAGLVQLGEICQMRILQSVHVVIAQLRRVRRCQ
jgi:hypothetical protein